MTIAVLGIDLGKNLCSLVGLEEDDALANEGATLSEIADMGQRASVKQVDLSEVRLKPHEYDAAFSKEALYCVRNKHHLLNQLAQALKPEGQLVFYRLCGAPGYTE